MSNVNHPAHYSRYPIEPIVICRWLGFDLGNVVKYLARAHYKGRELEDCQKALWYLEDTMQSGAAPEAIPHQAAKGLKLLARHCETPGAEDALDLIAAGDLIHAHAAVKMAIEKLEAGNGRTQK